MPQGCCPAQRRPPGPSTARHPSSCCDVPPDAPRPARGARAGERPTRPRIVLRSPGGLSGPDGHSYRSLRTGRYAPAAPDAFRRGWIPSYLYPHGTDPPAGSAPGARGRDSHPEEGDLAGETPDGAQRAEISTEGSPHGHGQQDDGEGDGRFPVEKEARMEGAPCIEGDQGPSGGDGPGRAYGLAEPWIPSPSGNRPQQEGQSDHEQGQYRVLRFPERLRKPGGRQMHQMKDVLEEPEGADMGAGCSSRDESGQENESQHSGQDPRVARGDQGNSSGGRQKVLERPRRTGQHRGWTGVAMQSGDAEGFRRPAVERPVQPSLEVQIEEQRRNGLQDGPQSIGAAYPIPMHSRHTEAAFLRTSPESPSAYPRMPARRLRIERIRPTGRTNLSEDLIRCSRRLSWRRRAESNR